MSMKKKQSQIENIMIMNRTNKLGGGSSLKNLIKISGILLVLFSCKNEKIDNNDLNQIAQEIFNSFYFLDTNSIILNNSTNKYYMDINDSSSVLLFNGFGVFSDSILLKYKINLDSLKTE